MRPLLAAVCVLVMVGAAMAQITKALPLEFAAVLSVTAFLVLITKCGEA
jgi:hypothetical protein